jgi:hypothetical protein
MNVPNYEEKNPYRLKNHIRAWYTDGSSKDVPQPYTSYPEAAICETCYVILCDIEIY